MPEKLLDLSLRAWHLLAECPIAFAVAGLLGALITWVAVRWSHRKEVEELQALLVQYEQKFGPLAQAGEAWAESTQKKLNRLLDLLHQGREICRTVPAANIPSLVEPWTKSCDAWVQETSGFLEKEGSSQAKARFMDVSALRISDFPRVPAELHKQFSTLGHRVQNLGRIAENPRFYLR